MQNVQFCDFLKRSCSLLCQRISWSVRNGWIAIVGALHTDCYTFHRLSHKCDTHNTIEMIYHQNWTRQTVKRNNDLIHVASLGSGARGEEFCCVEKNIHIECKNLIVSRKNC